MGIIPIVRPPGLASGGGGGATYTRTPLIAQQNVPAGFPVPIHTDMFNNATHNNAIFSNIQPDGGDLRVFEDSGLTTQLPLELISINTSTPFLLGYFRTTSAVTSGNTIAYLRTTISGGESQPSVTGTYGRNAVWQDYIGVSHDMETDSTGNGTISNTGGATLAAGLLNGYPARGYGTIEGTAASDASAFSQTDDPTSVSISLLSWLMTTGGSNQGRMFDREGGNHFRWNGPGGEFTFRRDFSSSTPEWAISQPSAQIWCHYLVAHDGSSNVNDPSIYQNGVLQALTTDINGSGTLSPNSNVWRFANSVAGDRVWGGRLGGARIKSGVLDAAWAGIESDGYHNPTGVVAAGSFSTL